MSEDRVVEALKALRDADRDVEAGPNVELRLMHAVGQRRVRHSWMGAGALVATMAAAAAVVILLHVRPAEPVRPIAPAPKAIAAAVEAVPALAAAIAAVPPRPRRARPVSPMPWSLHEVDTEFYPLMELAPSFERGELVRITVPASTMRDVGLFVNASVADQPVQADILVGQEGLARAIRFVSFE